MRDSTYYYNERVLVCGVLGAAWVAAWAAAAAARYAYAFSVWGTIRDMQTPVGAVRGAS